MIYFASAALVLLSIYPISYAKYAWAKNKAASLGIVLLVAATAALSVLALIAHRILEIG